jgi:coenzyme F420-0:L-glutamate ligase/coenzyme F420-1:gamma-L-glutamate ligase
MKCEISEDGLRFKALRGIGNISPGDDLPAILAASAERSRVVLSRGILVLCQKIVSKAEGRIVDLADVVPSEQAIAIAKEDEKDPRHVEVVLRETARIVRRGHRVMICETHHGFVCANAGVDLSNSPGDDTAVLLPLDSDASADALHKALVAQGSEQLGIVVTDTFGRPWRDGLVDIAIGSAGITPIVDQRGSLDLAGRELQVTTMALVDQIAAGAGILMVKDSGIPAVFVEGIIATGPGKTRDILRKSEEDLFR